MKRWLTHGFIVTYLGVLLMGMASHSLQVGETSHPGMFYIVWDMFCGWSSYSNRYHLIAEGESGDYYQVSPAPWGELKPYGYIDRRHYDSFGTHVSRMGLNILKQTSHEDMTRLFVVEESWAKKYNMPDRLWDVTYEEPKSMHKYFHLRQVLTPDGVALLSNPSWLSRQYTRSLADNPRVIAEMNRSRPYYSIAPHSQTPRLGIGNPYEKNARPSSISSMLGE